MVVMKVEMMAGSKDGLMVVMKVANSAYQMVETKVEKLAD